MHSANILCVVETHLKIRSKKQYLQDNVKLHGLGQMDDENAYLEKTSINAFNICAFQRLKKIKKLVLNSEIMFTMITTKNCRT